MLSTFKLPYVPDVTLPWCTSFIQRFYELCNTVPINQRKLKLLCTSNGGNNYSGKTTETEYVTMSLGLFGHLLLNHQEQSTNTVNSILASSQDQFYLAQCSIYIAASVSSSQPPSSSRIFPSSLAPEESSFSSSSSMGVNMVASKDTLSIPSLSGSELLAPSELPELYSALELLPSRIIDPQFHELKEINLWVNLDPSYSRTHFDTDDNYLAVLQGKKEVRVISPQGMQDLVRQINSFNFSGSSSTSSVSSSLLPVSSVMDHDINHHSVDLFTLHCTFPHLIQSFTISPGSVLFIPEGWWHAVQSEERTIAINYWYAGTWACIANSPDFQLPYLLESTLQTYKLSLLRKVRQEWIQDSFTSFTTYILQLSREESFLSLRILWKEILSLSYLETLKTTDTSVYFSDPSTHNINSNEVSRVLSVNAVGDSLWVWIQDQILCLRSMDSSDSRYISTITQINNVFVLLTRNNSLCIYVYKLMLRSIIQSTSSEKTIPYVIIPSNNIVETLTNVWNEKVWELMINLWDTVPIVSSNDQNDMLTDDRSNEIIVVNNSKENVIDTMEGITDKYTTASKYVSIKVPEHIFRTISLSTVWTPEFFELWWILRQVPNPVHFCLHIQHQIHQKYLRPLLRAQFEKFIE